MSHETDKSFTTFCYNGQEYRFDIENIDDAEKWEAAFEKMKEAEKSIKKDGKKSEYIRGYCKMIRDLFDNLFGDGASNAICGEKYNSRTDTEAYKALVNFVADQTEAGLEQKNAIATNFLNRAQRRAAAKAANKS